MMRSDITVLSRLLGAPVLIQGKWVRTAIPELGSYEPLADPEKWIDALRASGEADLFTFMQLMPDCEPKFPYPMESDNLAVCPISSFDHWWRHQIDTASRNRARKAGKEGVIVAETPFSPELVHGIWEVYNESAVRQGKRNRHYGKTVEQIHEAEATFLERSLFIGAWLGVPKWHLVGFVKLTTDSLIKPTQASFMNIVSMVKHRDKAVSNALVMEAVRACAQRGIRYLVYGSFVYGRKKPDGLTRFKESNGFLRYNLPRYYVPLNQRGQIALALGLHQRFRDHIPEVVLEKLRDWRSVWYNRKTRPGLLERLIRPSVVR